MMTQTELRAYYRDRASLRATEETLAGLREYAAASDDDLEQEIAELEKTVREQATAFAARGAEVLTTLEAVDNICCRMELRLHFYRGMAWKEIATIVGGTEICIKDRCLKALNKCIPK